jgi:iron complex transport system substrate-binding protein
MRRSPALAAACTLAALALTACGTTEPAAGDDTGKSAAKIRLTDATGTKVTLDGPAKRVVGTEWNAVESLVSLGVNPVGVADVKGYKAYDSAVPLRDSPKNIGTRGEPSTDTIASLHPDLVVATTDLSSSVLKQLRRVAPVLTLRSADAADPIGQMKDNLDLVAKATGTTAGAAEVRKSFDAKITEGRKALAGAGLDGTRYAFADGYAVSNQVTIRPYTSGSLIGAVSEEIGLKNAWTVKGDKSYGLASTDVEGLTGLGDVRFAYIANDSDGDDPFADGLAKNSVWKSLKFVRDDHVSRLPDGIWMFGGPESMEAYVDAVVDALTK